MFTFLSFLRNSMLDVSKNFEIKLQNNLKDHFKLIFLILSFDVLFCIRLI